jgi:hypothetical protein
MFSDQHGDSCTVQSSRETNECLSSGMGGSKGREVAIECSPNALGGGLHVHTSRLLSCKPGVWNQGMLLGRGMARSKIDHNPRRYRLNLLKVAPSFEEKVRAPAHEHIALRIACPEEFIDAKGIPEKAPRSRRWRLHGRGGTTEIDGEIS